MFLPDDPTAVANQYAEGTPGVSLPTSIRADHLNAITNEIANVITTAGASLVKADSTQLYTAIQALITAGAVVPAAKAAAKNALNDLRLACATGAAHTLRAVARKASTRRVVAVGDSGTIVSSDGYTPFTSETPDAVYAAAFNDIVYDASLDLFIAVGDSGEIQTAPDGQTWIERVGSGNDRLAIASDGAGRLVVVGTSGSIRRSSTGTSWTSPTNPFSGTPRICSVTYGANLFVIVTDQGDIASSPDGTTWTVRQALAGSTTTRARVMYDSTLGFLYHYGTTVYHSSNGTSWTSLHNAVPTSSTTVPGLFVLPYCWLIVATSGTGGARLDGRYSVSAVNAAADFTIDFVNGAGDLQCLELLNGQIWATATDNVYVGGVL